MTIAHDEAVLDEASINTLFHEARTANTFTGEVTDQQLQAIWELTKYGPTAFNSQPLRVTFFRKGENRDKLVSALAGGNQAKTAAAPVVAVLAFDKNWNSTWDRFSPAWDGSGIFAGQEEAAAATGNNNAHIQAGYFILAVRSLGLAAGPMTGADFNAIDEAFFTERDQKSFLVVNIGHAGEDAWGEPKPKFGFEDTVTVL